MNDITMTLTGETALTMKYAVALARRMSPQFDDMTDSEVISRLVEMGLDCGKEATV